ncbi:MAG: hypothetical protein RL701_4035 [Pseudomonadota bacterium]
MAARTLEKPVLVAPPKAQVSAALPYAAPALAEVYEANFQYVFRCLRSLGVRSDMLDDALQDVFLVVQNKLAAFDGRSQLRTWLYAIVLRVGRRYRALAAREQRQDCDAELSDGPSPATSHSAGANDAFERSLEQKERWVLAQRALSTLDDDKREVFVLSQVEQMSAPEIAEIVGIPVNTVYSRLRAARLEFAAFAERMRAQNSHRAAGGTP